MIKQSYQLVLHLQGPILSQASGTLVFGVDAAMQRYREKPVLNGTQIRGNLRHVLLYFKNKLPESEHKTRLINYLKNWFPDEPQNKEDNTPNYDTHRSTLDFDLFWHTQCAIKSTEKTRTRIQIDADKGKVKEGALQVVEDLFPSGSRVAFSGRIHARFFSKDEQHQFEAWMAKALQWLGAVGSQKGVGYGRLLDHEFRSVTQSSSPNPIMLSDNDTRFGIRLHLDRPFCIGRQRSKEDNRIVSHTDIPGQIIKGVIAQQIKERDGINDPNALSTLLDETFAFNDLTFTHAKPVEKPSLSRPQAIPLNLAKTDKQWQQYTTEDPLNMNWHEMPSFQPDWKAQDWDNAEKFMKSPSTKPDRYLLVRTAIEPGKNAAKKHALFSLECVDNHGFDWCADVDLSKIKPNMRPTVINNLRILMNDGLHGIGKTRARAMISITSPFSSLAPLDEKATQWQITLQTATRMLPFEIQVPSINGQDKLREYYEKYWHEASNGELTLLNYFAQQKMVGNDYFHHHFRKANNKSYAPEWLTTAGSVFILQSKPDSEGKKARERLNEWQQSNLPAWESDSDKAHWKSTVHIPQHGYGEITVKAIKTR